MKIAIFGDSFAAPLFKWKEDVGLKSWVDHLSEKYDVTNFAVEGSGLYYSVSQFKILHRAYDKIIFVVTAPGRLFINDNPYLKQHGEHFGSLSTAEFIFNEHKDKDNAESIELTKIAKAVIQYYTYIQRDDYDRFVHDLQIDYISKTRPDTILLRSFNDIYRKDTCLYDITEMENKHWGLPRLYNSPIDARRCHMSKENNLILAGLAERWLQGEPVNININDFVAPADDKSLYNII